MKYEYIVIDYPDGYQEVIARCATHAEAQKEKERYCKFMKYKCSAHILKKEIAKENSKQ